MRRQNAECEEKHESAIALMRNLPKKGRRNIAIFFLDQIDHTQRSSWEKVLSDPAVPLWMKPLLITQKNIWDYLERQRHELDALVNEELTHWPEAELLMEIPGFGPIVRIPLIPAT